MDLDQQTIDRSSLLAIANQMIAEHKDFFDGMATTGVEQKGEVLIFSGDYFLDEQGLPGPHSTAVFNVFKFLAVELSPKYRLDE
ncbi:DUF2498 family protein [Erwinia sp. S38]|uniref:DUF2498 family protein n=1 Tax=Erwinia sp. S38 TaxID=2769338 RepID=UPI00190E2612|nr:DUF2498 family protein [Erwinia sp. S38]MBK0000087.1 DUF2498 family protein [Erwinia sp. S38]